LPWGRRFFVWAEIGLKFVGGLAAGDGSVGFSGKPGGISGSEPEFSAVGSRFSGTGLIFSVNRLRNSACACLDN